MLAPLGSKIIVSFVRKPICLPTAPSKLFRIKENTFYSYGKINQNREVHSANRQQSYPTSEFMKREQSFKDSILPPEWREMRFKYPEFLPSIKESSRFRNPLREKLERIDMLRRRSVINIPEFYVGSIMAVEVSDRYALGKESLFVGICIHREGQGLWAAFTLRNIVDGHGIEIRYDLYNPSIRRIEVLKLEKRIDNDLRYLRDALPQYSTFPFDMMPVPQDENVQVPLNKLVVKMKPRPWSHVWERHDFQGIEELSGVSEYMYLRRRRPEKGYHKYLKYDTMVHYREHIPEEEQYEIWKDMADHEKSVGDVRRAARRKKLIQEQLKKKFVP